jgi:hypothetical protein
MIRETIRNLLIVLGITGYMIGNHYLGKWLFEVLGIGGLIGWGLGFFLVTGAVYLYWDKKDREKKQW